ncbi:VWA domain-containing protein [Methylobacillus caricis]|uniref:VWA domain-containing protein n=1 Tax=Methylobacillus caricis TaxID=1971611 RepID=UPI001D0013FC|nr:VWA domain-containing protein [Methylobacillus caricis]MCB5187917.1 VWA domain-containing protein [Methylobacillus caricis]
MLKRLLSLLRRYFHRDTALLAIAMLLLVAAAFKPTVPMPRNIYSYMLVVDISQSMNTKGMFWRGREVTRLEYAKHMMHDLVAAMPCGSRVSLTFFSGLSVAALYTPIEVCASYAAIQDTIARAEWRQAWSGNTRLREGVDSLSRLLRTMPEPTQPIFFTDGEEAPRLHAFNTRDLSNFQGGNGWLIVGIGSKDPKPIPKLDESNKVIGYWSAENFTMQPGIAQISQQNFGNRDDGTASSENDRYQSRLDEEYLLKLSKEIGANYVNGESMMNVKSAMDDLKPSRRDFSPMQIDWLLVLVSGLLVLSSYAPQRLIKLLRRILSRRTAN